MELDPLSPISDPAYDSTPPSSSSSNQDTPLATPTPHDGTISSSTSPAKPKVQALSIDPTLFAKASYERRKIHELRQLIPHQERHLRNIRAYRVRTANEGFLRWVGSEYTQQPGGCAIGPNGNWVYLKSSGETEYCESVGEEGEDREVGVGEGEEGGEDGGSRFVGKKGIRWEDEAEGGDAHGEEEDAVGSMERDARRYSASVYSQDYEGNPTGLGNGGASNSTNHPGRFGPRALIPHCQPTPNRPSPGARFHHRLTTIRQPGPYPELTVRSRSNASMNGYANAYAGKSGHGDPNVIYEEPEEEAMGSEDEEQMEDEAFRVMNRGRPNKQVKRKRDLAATGV
ncbi:hypothetical protein P154DRAFT_43310 [Amniculicola lignicola CBS 123094]|uniref:Uncharacterized protein n=1 Tax=Amniculicola lignicola CBS 123094 TaxID=1392246 RepID=A0A6A5X1U0_9PLEO|nr:hypothetical protein P154DRAFT_43310 [Amniculicola lignicola CBS 123094]